jgi:RNA 2',3'-cyclic 3'-phosphodiesterase
MKRIFVGIALPEKLRAEVSAFAARLALRLSGVEASWVPERNYHLTLEFLGSTDLEREVRERLSAIRCEPFSVTLSGVGAFPRMTRARVLWLGVENRELGELARRIESALEPLGFSRHEFEPFKGHLTLARLKRPAPVGDALKAERGVVFSSFAVEEVVVYESKTTPTGAEYQVLDAIRLTPPAAKT